MEKNKLQIEELDLKGLGLEILEIDTDTMLEEMGASIGINACCSVIVPIN